MRKGRWICLVMVVLFFGLSVEGVAADPQVDELKNEVQELKGRVKQLEGMFEKQQEMIKTQQAVIERYRQEPSSGNLEAEVVQLRKEVNEHHNLININQTTIDEYHDRFEYVDILDNPKYRQSDGINISIHSDAIMQTTFNANGASLSKRGEDVTDFNYATQIGFQKDFGDFAYGYMQLNTGDGANVRDELQLFSNVNQSARYNNYGDHVDLETIFYETRIFNQQRTTFTIGKLASYFYIGSNDYNINPSVGFLDETFYADSVLELPAASMGVRLGHKPSEKVEYQILAMDGSQGPGDAEDVFDDIFVAGQVNIMPNLFSRNGNYRFYGWTNTSDHTRWLDPLATQEPSYGFGLSFDQAITDEIGLLLLYDWNDPHVYMTSGGFILEHRWALGAQVLGKLWGREKDKLGIAFGQGLPPDQFQEADPTRNADPENHLEAFYNIYINDHLTVAPDVQFIWNPYGNDGSTSDDMIVVAGTRVAVDF